jgi:hypothetical protein
MSGQAQSFLAAFRQRAPCAGLFLSASLGILISDAQPDWWIIWAVVSLFSIGLVLKIRSSFLACLSILLVFASWHGYQIAMNSGYLRSREPGINTSEHTVTLRVQSEPKIDQYLSASTTNQQIFRL